MHDTLAEGINMDKKKQHFIRAIVMVLSCICFLHFTFNFSLINIGQTIIPVILLPLLIFVQNDRQANRLPIILSIGAVLGFLALKFSGLSLFLTFAALASTPLSIRAT